MSAESTASSRIERVIDVLEVPMLAAVPLAMALCALFDVSVSAFVTFTVALLAIGFMAWSAESRQPALRTMMPVVTLAALAAAGRVLFSPFPDVKPVSAICIVAGVALGRRAGFATGALAALVSNFFFGQGAWTPMQMYAWGMVGYVAGLLAQTGATEKPWVVYAWGFVSGLFYGALLNGWHVLGFVRPITWVSTVAAFAAAIPLDVTHGIATVVFLMLIWGPWKRAIARVVAKYGLG